MNPNDTPKTIEDALKVYADAGIVVEPEHLTEAYVVAARRRKELELQAQDDTSKLPRYKRIVEEFNKWYPKFLQTLLGVGDVLMTLTETVLVAFVVPLLLVGFIIVEQQRVVHGSRLWEVNAGLAEFGAWVLVIGNLIFELVANWQEHQEKWPKPKRTEFSFRVIWERIKYMLGVPVNSNVWEPRPKSPAYRARAVLRFITIAILMLAISGSMTDVIKDTKGNWYTALVAIFTDSSLLQFVTWLGGLLFALAVVLGAQALTEYISEKVVSIVAVMQAQADDRPRQIAEAAGVAAAYYLYSRFREKQRMLRQQRTAATAADMPQLTGYSGRVIVPAGQGYNASGTEVNDFSPDSADGTDGTGEGTKTKIEQAIVLLQQDRTLRRLSSRKLAEMFPEKDIKHKTWVEAKRRLGIKQ